MSGAQLLDGVVAYLRRFVVMTPAQADAVALWIVHTHTIEAASATPYMSVSSAVRESGKSRLGEAVAMLVARPLPTANISTAALFRVIDAQCPTLLFDEVDATFNAKTFDEEKRGILNAGYTRGQRVYRMGGRTNTELQSFKVFCPKLLMGIGNLPDTLASRSIPIVLKRKKRTESVERFQIDHARSRAEPLRLALEEWADHQLLDELRAARPADLLAISDRAFDCWEPLLAITCRSHPGPSLVRTASRRTGLPDCSGPSGCTRISAGTTATSSVGTGSTSWKIHATATSRRPKTLQSGTPGQMAQPCGFPAISRAGRVRMRPSPRMATFRSTMGFVPLSRFKPG